MNTISREELKKKMERNENFALVEVLSAKDYEDFHLPGAINVPLGDDFDARIRAALPDKQQPIVVYCKNEACPTSATAAQKLEKSGYGHVYRYTAGKEDWKAAGLRVESSGKHAPKASA